MLKKIKIDSYWVQGKVRKRRKKSEAALQNYTTTTKTKRILIQAITNKLFMMNMNKYEQLNIKTKNKHQQQQYTQYFNVNLPAIL